MVGSSLGPRVAPSRQAHACPTPSNPPVPPAAQAHEAVSNLQASLEVAQQEAAAARAAARAAEELADKRGAELRRLQHSAQVRVYEGE